MIDVQWRAVRLLWAMAVGLIAGLAPAASLAAQPLPPCVLILGQSDPGSPWYMALNQALRSTLKAAPGPRVTIYSEDLDLARFGNSQYERILLGYFREKYRDRPIGIIVAVGSVTLEVMLRLRAQLWPDVPVVFAAVDQNTAGRLGRPPGVTGTVIRLTFRDAVTAARALVPGLKRIALVGDPLERQTFRRHYTQEIPVFGAGLEIIDLTGLPMTALRTRVSRLPEDTAIVYTTITDGGEGTTYIPRDALVAFADVANRPIVIDSAVEIGYGGTGGFVVEPVPVGEDAARLALRIFNGENPANIPVVIGSFTKPVFDWHQLRRWNVGEERLPPGSEVRFRELTAWEHYRWQIVLVATVMLLQAGLIGGLLFEHRYRRKAETLARQRMFELAHMNRSATAGELSASIAHEVNQPLTGMVANANACLRWLASAAPDFGEMREALKQIVTAGHHASHVIGSARAMFKKDAQERTLLDINQPTRDVLALVDGELRKQRISVFADLDENLPRVTGDRVQLQQVILNLIMNAVDAMASVTDRARVLRVESQIHEPDGVLVSVEDSGTGIDPKDIERIFAPLFTTKPEGMGMGLSICRSIIEAHDGRLWASAGAENGSVFRFVLPNAGGKP